MSVVLKGGVVYKEGRLLEEDLYLKEGLISEPFQGAKEINVKGLTILPGMIDSQVHFREPGLTHKEDLILGSKQALIGGVTGFFDMPNTVPATINEESLRDKIKRVENKSWVHSLFYVGATAKNVENLKNLEILEGACGVKIFMGSSTGSLLLSDEEAIEKVVSQLKGRFAVHSENEEMLVKRAALFFPDKEKEYSVNLHPEWRNEEVALASTKTILRISKKYNAKLHLLHVSTEEEMEFLRQNKYENMSVEVTPQHLTLSSPECYENFGSFAQMNPPIRSKRHQEALWKALNEGLVDTIGSDHAPHTKEEKSRPYPKSPSGIPGVQTMLPLMLDHVSNGKLSLSKLVELLSLNPAKLFKLKNLGELKIGRQADLSVVDLRREFLIDENWLKAKVGWSPFLNKKVKGYPAMTVIKGQLSYRDGELLGSPQGELFDKEL